MKALVACCLFAAGCAIQPFELSRLSDVSVCKLSTSGGPETAQNAREEAARRKLTCTG